MLSVPLERCGAELSWGLPLVLQAVICGTAITAVELLAGLVLNVWLGLGIWDYSGLPGNLWSQICPHFWALWRWLSTFGIVALDWMRYAVEGGERLHYVLI